MDESGRTTYFPVLMDRSMKALVVAVIMCPISAASTCTDGAGSCALDDETSLLQATQLLKPGQERQPAPLGENVEVLVDKLIHPDQIPVPAVPEEADAEEAVAEARDASYINAMTADDRMSTPVLPAPPESPTISEAAQLDHQRDEENAIPHESKAMSAYMAAKALAEHPIEVAGTDRREFAHNLIHERRQAYDTMQEGLYKTKRDVHKAYHRSRARIKDALDMRHRANRVARHQIRKGKRMYARSAREKHDVETSAVLGGWAGQQAGANAEVAANTAFRHHEWAEGQVRRHNARVMARAERVQKQEHAMTKALHKREAGYDALAAHASRVAGHMERRDDRKADRVADTMAHEVYAIDQYGDDRFNHYAEKTDHIKELTDEIAQTGVFPLR